MIDCLEMMLERLAGYGDALLDDQRRLGGGQGIAFDRVGRVRQFKVLRVLEIDETSRSTAAEPVKFGFLLRDALPKIVHFATDQMPSESAFAPFRQRRHKLLFR